MRRVVVTGMGGITALGQDWPAISAALRDGRTAIRAMSPEWDRFEGVNTRLAAPVLDFTVPEHWSRKKTRTMGRVAKLAVAATEKALADAGLLNDPVLTGGRAGAAFGSSFGSPDSVLGFYELKMSGKSKNLNATTYIQMMSHTALVNVGLFFGLKGRMIPTSNACASASQAIGFAAEAIKWGKADVMIAGGAEELDITDSAVFDTLFATSIRNDAPHLSPRPFDRDRDGLVIGEGAGALILEEYERARARGATIHAEVVGFGTNADGNHVTQPQAETMEIALRLALEDAGLSADAIGVVNGHGTATEGGDIAEAAATAAVFGRRVALHSLKSYFGHSLGACGAIEAWLGIEMMREGWCCHTANLDNVDPRCAELDYIMGRPRRTEAEYFMSNNFAFGGVNASLIFRRTP
ncbi:putative 3-oxoacyl-(Acyl carrier protein) synthase II [Magnetospirillum sp. XM-1]|uniref:beta-ketoacyl-ACP synthase n=1 Tax=Magnetospirillum sp. XM-1 TaxID=1663591 RepID=UPI00073DEED2|nr:beta-ketoacyl-ACP synthase [Magnetospirillum sp. XM-1]CUW39567.1 putative 3-oxoacyl-(Acyl carrier protein) synthase II [Magnetospirillum sp. XM-1]